MKRVTIYKVIHVHSVELTNALPAAKALYDNIIFTAAIIRCYIVVYSKS